MHSFTSKTRHPLVLSLAALLLAAACGRAAAPTVSSTTPAADATNVPLNVKLSATFDLPMSPLTTTTFTLAQGSTPIAGTVANAPGGRSATFSPSAALTAATVFTATLTTGARSTEGVALEMNRSWTFTTGMGTDTTAPTVTAVGPLEGSVGVATNTRVTARFSKAMDPLTLNATSFTVKQGGSDVPGSITYGPGATVTFRSAAALATNTLFTMNLSTTIKDLQGNALAAPKSWSFTTGIAASLGPAPVELGTAGNFTVLAKAAVSTVPSSNVTGDIGLGPAAASYLTGFSLVADATNVFALSPQVTGKLYAASYAVPTPANLTVAVADMESAYTDAESRPTPDHLELSTGNLGGLTLAPGLYKWTSSITVPADVTFSGGANDTWILQTTGDLSLDAMKRVVLSGGAQAKNIVWQVAGKVTLGAASHFEGVVLGKTEVTLQTGATMNGRLLAQTQVALQQAVVTQPAQ